MAKATNKCAHPACTCVAGSDSKYCSQYCEDAGDTMEIACNCGHAGCSVSEGRPTMTAKG